MTDFFQVIKKNASWYFISMLVTGITSFAAIVITKSWLTPEMFIRFNLKLNAVFMINTICLSWISLSIFRMYHQKKSFFKADNLLLLALANALLLGIPLLVIWFWLIKPGGSFYWPLLFLLLAFGYQIILVSHQAALNAKRSAMAEAVRGISTMLLMLLPVVGHFEVDENYFWKVWLVAYLLALLPLWWKGNRSWLLFGKGKHKISGVDYFTHLKEIFRFGSPFVIWMFFSFLLSFADRWYITTTNLPDKVVADYLALADAIFRGCGFLFVPLNTSGYPVISRLYDAGDTLGTFKLILKVVKTEALLLLVAMLAALAVYKVIMNSLNIDTFSHSQMILLLISLMASHGAWQICGMLQKPAEMSMKTIWLALANAIGSGIVYALLYWLVQPQSLLGIVWCLGAGILFYAMLVSWQLYRFGKKQVV